VPALPQLHFLERVARAPELLLWGQVLLPPVQVQVRVWARARRCPKIGFATHAQTAAVQVVIVPVVEVVMIAFRS
jgi:hypothetical protein